MITLIKGTEAACGTNAAGASTFGEQSVSLIQQQLQEVTVIDEVGGYLTW